MGNHQSNSVKLGAKDGLKASHQLRMLLWPLQSASWHHRGSAACVDHLPANWQRCTSRYNRDRAWSSSRSPTGPSAAPFVSRQHL